MRKILFIAVLVFACTGLRAQQSQAEKTTRVKEQEDRVAVKPATSFSMPAARQQAGWWQQQASANPSSAQAWVQWGLWAWRSNRDLFGNAAAVKNIYQQAGAHISNTGEYLLLRFLQSNKTDSAAIYGALEKMADKKTVYPFIIHYDIIRNNSAELKKHCLAYQKLQPLAAGSALYKYHSNVLQSAVENATIAAAGENDLVPLALLQQVHGVRTDIHIAYLQPAVLQVNNRQPVYVCLSAGESLLKTYGRTLSFSGLLARVVNSQDNSDYTTRADVLNLDYLEAEVFSGLQAELHNNYLPGLLLAYQHYQLNNTAKAERYKKLIIKTATEGGKLAAVQPLLKNSP